MGFLKRVLKFLLKFIKFIKFLLLVGKKKKFWEGLVLYMNDKVVFLNVVVDRMRGLMRLIVKNLL